MDHWINGTTEIYPPRSLRTHRQEYTRILDLGAADTNLSKNSRQHKMLCIPYLSLGAATVSLQVMLTALTSSPAYV